MSACRAGAVGGAGPRGPCWSSWSASPSVSGRRGAAPPPTAAQRANAIDALVRCPSCDGISVADSSASTAVAIRHAVTARVRAGQSDGQIDAFLVSRYGPGILLRPPVRGWTAWVWALPPVALLAAGGACGLVRCCGAGAGTSGAAPVSVSAEDRALVERALVTGRVPTWPCSEPGRSEPGRSEPGRSEVVRAP